MKAQKYKRNYFMPPKPSYEWVKKEFIEQAPTWCSVDLRDGNQALITPMSLEEKIKFFKLLLEIGFKEIEVGFPAASATEFEFTRYIIEKGLIPKGVSIQVLTQAREHIIKKTLESLNSCEKAIVHFYNSTSFAQRQQVFKKNKDEVKSIALNAAKLLKDLTKGYEERFVFEYSPESFTGTEVEYALEVCNAVIEILKPNSKQKCIINLPATVEMSMPHIYASQVEYFCKNIKERQNVIISLHPHNDRGCGIAAAELGLLAGADRVEGTLFGNGERTGNVDIITLALNLLTHGVDPKLDFSDLPRISEIYEKVSKMSVYERQPYSGKLVFAAFSGSHQDAIAKGMAYHQEFKLQTWSVPYLSIDPKDLSRAYESDVIRINSQSGKGGIAYILEQNYGFSLPKDFKECFSYHVKDISDKAHKELSVQEIHDIFMKDFVNFKGKLALKEFHFKQEDKVLEVNLHFSFENKDYAVKAKGNGRLDAVANALRATLKLEFDIADYSEHSLSKGSSSKAISYVQIKDKNQKSYFGAGINSDIISSSIQALFVAVNHSLK